eukprot:1349313-Amorphochlora_amoeboformis.AAC.2
MKKIAAFVVILSFSPKCLHEKTKSHNLSPRIRTGSHSLRPQRLAGEHCTCGGVSREKRPAVLAEEAMVAYPYPLVMLFPHEFPRDVFWLSFSTAALVPMRNRSASQARLCSMSIHTDQTHLTHKQA